MRGERRGVSENGSTPAEMIVGAGLGLVALLCAFSLARGTLLLGDRLLDANEAREAAHWALARIADELACAGLGLAPPGSSASPDEALELLEERAVGTRGDLDRGRVGDARTPEEAIAGVFPVTSTGNDEVTLFLRRAGSSGGRGRALFEADLDGPDRVLVGPTPVARRDGAVETIDAGPFALEGGVPGTLYRVSFVHDARRAGTGRFRVMRPLLDEVLDFRVEALDAEGRAVSPCGGDDDASARACRASVRALRLEIVVASRGVAQRVERFVALPHARGPQ